MTTTARAATTTILLGALLLLGIVFGQRDDLAAGQRIFNETAGGVGCAFCHGLEGRGNGTSGVGAPDILGSQMAAIRASLSGGVPEMSFIQLNERELAAVAAYLEQLSLPARDDASPEGTSDVGAAPTAPSPFFTVNVEITDEGFRPTDIEIPVGQTVKLVIRNRTSDEHHYRIVGLAPRNLLWLAEPEPDEAAEGVSDEDHEAHHNTSYVAWRSAGPSGVQPSGDEVHAWAFQYSPGGGIDSVIFQATEVGSFEVVDPLEPTFRGTVTVY